MFEPLQIARSLNLDGIVREGVYVMVGGPNYETVAELKMLRELGRETYLQSSKVKIVKILEFSTPVQEWTRWA